jgi:hypothetical protein
MCTLNGVTDTTHGRGVPVAAAEGTVGDLASTVEAMEPCIVLPDISGSSENHPAVSSDDGRTDVPDDKQDSCLSTREGTHVSDIGTESDLKLTGGRETGCTVPAANDCIVPAPENGQRELLDRMHFEATVDPRTADVIDAKITVDADKKAELHSSSGLVNGGNMKDLASCLDETVQKTEACQIPLAVTTGAIEETGTVIEVTGVQSSTGAGKIGAALQPNAEESRSSESSSETESSSSSESDSDSRPAGPNTHSRIRRALTASEVVEPDSDEEGRIEPTRTRNEQDLENMIVPPIDIEISPEFSLIPVGIIKSIMEKVIVIESLPNALTSKPVAPSPYAGMSDVISNSVALDSDTVICLSASRRPLGRIFETFGPVTSPFYVVRFNSRGDIEKFGETARVGAQVSYVREMSCMVVAGDIRKRGYDSSNINDEELPTESLDYSDDDAEAAAKRVKKRGSLSARGIDVDGAAGGNGVRQKRPGNYGSRGGRYNGARDDAQRGHPGTGHQGRAWGSVRGEHHGSFQNQGAPRHPNSICSEQENALARMAYRSPSLPANDGRSHTDHPHDMAPQPFYQNGVAIPSIHPMMAQQFLRHQQNPGQPGELRVGNVPGQGDRSNASNAIPRAPISLGPAPYPTPQSPWRAQVNVPYHGFIGSGMPGPAMLFNPQLGVGYPGVPIPFPPGNLMHRQNLQSSAGNGHQVPPYRPLGPATAPGPNRNPAFPYSAVPHNMPPNVPSWDAARSQQQRRRFPPKGGQ